MEQTEIDYITERAAKLDDHALRAIILNRGFSIADYIGFGPDATKQALAKVEAAPKPTADHSCLPIYKAEFARRVRAKCGM